MPRLYDISLSITGDMLVFPGDPGVTIEPESRIAEGADANVSRLSLGSHTGTHVDAARHFIDGAQGVDAIPLETLVGDAVVIRIPDEVREIDAHALGSHDLQGAVRVLLRTRNSALLGRNQFDTDFAYLTGAGAEYLADAGVVLVGIDYLSVERYGSEDFPAHHALLRRGIVILEGADLREVPAGRYELFCLPLRIAGADGAPARAILRSTA